MVEKDLTSQCSVTLRNSQINKIDAIVNSGKYKSYASFFQNIVDDFFSNDKKYVLKDAIIFIVYPMVISFILFKVSIDFSDIWYFYANLLVFGITIASIYNFFYKLRKR